MDTVHIDSRQGPSSPDNPAQDRDSGWAAGAHLIALFFSVVGAIIITVVVGRQNPFVRQHARQAVNFQLNVCAGGLIGALLTAIAPAFILTWVPLAIAALVLPIVATVRANRGEWQPYPPMIPFLANLPQRSV